ncbi:MAG TPA: DinB family protein [Pyrinomonadaceae bacterium]|nr:DinB family protein [Pyrinomonadaceae bacterium]
MTPQEQLSASEVERIRDQFRRAFDGEAWHGPSVLVLLDGITAQQAAAHPIPGAHSIWELTQHIAAWERACKRRLEGDPARLTDEEDWEPVNDTSEAAWEKTKQQLIDTHRELLEAIARVDESRLNEPIIKDLNTPFSSVYVTLHGGVQHNLYHAGQIAMLKKALVNL